MLGRLCEWLAFFAAARRRAFWLVVPLLSALALAALVRLPRPADFWASLEPGSPVYVARALQAEIPLVRLRIEHVPAAGAEGVLLALRAALPADGVYVSLDGGAVDADATARVASEALATLPKLGALLALAEDAPLAQGLGALDALPGGLGVPSIRALRGILTAGDSPEPQGLYDALTALAPADAPGGLRFDGDGLDVWLRGRPGVDAEALRRGAEPLLAALRARELRGALDGYPLALAPTHAGRGRIVAALAPMAVLVALAFALGVPLRAAALAALGASASLGLPLAALLLLVGRTDPAAVYALAVLSGLIGALCLAFLVLHEGRDLGAMPPLVRLRATLRDTALPFGWLAALLLLSAAGTRWSAPASAALMLGAAAALLLLWGGLLPMVLALTQGVTLRLPGAELARIPPRKGAWPPARRAQGAAALLALVTVGLVLVPGAAQSPNHPRPRAGWPLAWAVETDRAAAERARLAELSGLVRVEGQSESLGLAADARAGLKTALEALERPATGAQDALGVAEPAALGPEAQGVAEALGAADAAGPVGARRRYVAEEALRHGVERLRRRLRGQLEAGLAPQAPRPLFAMDGGRALLVAVPAGHGDLGTLRSPLDTEAAVRGDARWGGMSLVSSGCALVVSALVGVVSAGPYFALLPVALLLGAVPVLRADELLGVAPSTLAPTAAWFAALAAAVGAAVALRLRTGAPARLSLRFGVGAVALCGLAVGHALTQGSAFGGTTGAALWSAVFALVFTRLMA